MAVVTSCDVSDPDPDDPLLEDTRPREEFTEFLKTDGYYCWTHLEKIIMVRWPPSEGL